MVAYYGVHATKKLSTTAPADRTPIGADYGGDVKYMKDTYVSTGAEAAGSTIKVGDIPAGWRLLDWVIAHGALGTSVTLAMGDGGSGTRYKAATAAATAGTMQRAATVANLAYVDTVDRELLLTTAGATLDAAITIVSVAIIGRA